MTLNRLTLLAISLLTLGLLPGTAGAQIVQGSGSSGPPRDQRPALPPADFVKAAYSLVGSDFASKVRGIPERRIPSHVYGDDSEGNLLVLADEGVISVGPDGQTFLRIPAARLVEAGLGAEELKGPATRDPLDGSVFTVNATGDIVRIPAATLEPIEKVVEAVQIAPFAQSAEYTINDLLWANGVVWIAADGSAGLMRYDPDNGALTHMYDPITDLDTAGTGSTDAGVKALAHESGRAEIVFAVGWNVGGRDGGDGRIGGVNADGLLFRLASTDDDLFFEDEPLVRGLVALGGGAYAAAQKDGEVWWFNYSPDFERAMPMEGGLNILRALIDNVDEREDIRALGLAGDCEGRAYLSTTVGIVAVREADRSLVPGDVLLVAGKPELLRVTPFGEPMIFREGGLGQEGGQASLALQTASALARSPVDGHVAVADEGAHRVFRFSPDGLKLPEYEADLPYQVGFDAEGNLYYLDRSFKVDREDEFERNNFKSNIPTVVSRPIVGGRQVLYQFEDGDWGETAMAVRADGAVVVAQLWQAGEPVHGRVVEIPAGGGEPTELLTLESPQALFVDTEGDLWIGEQSTQAGAGARILRLPAQGELETVFPQPGTESNPLRIPAAISETDDGRLIVADRDADSYPGATRTAGLFFLEKDGSELRVLLDHPDFRDPQGVGVIFVPPFECASYRDCPTPSCREEEKVCPPKDEDCAEDAATCPPADECPTEELQCPALACSAGQCEIPAACKVVPWTPPPPADDGPGDDGGCLGCVATPDPAGVGVPAAWWGALLRR